MANDTMKTNHAIAARLYQERGFQHRIGYGIRPALLNIDLANAWTRKGSPFECENVDEMLAQVQRLLEGARVKRIPIVFTTTGYERDLKDAEPWIRKIPALAVLQLDSELCRIDERLAPRPGEIVLPKKMASAPDGRTLLTP